VYRYSGIFHQVVKNRWYFVFGSQAIRYRHGIPPLQPIEIQTFNVYWDDKWIYLTGKFICPKTGKLYAEGLSRIMLRKGRDPVDPRALHKSFMGDYASEFHKDVVMPDIVRDFLAWDASTDASMKSFTEQNTCDPPKKISPVVGSMNIPFLEKQ